MWLHDPYAVVVSAHDLYQKQDALEGCIGRNTYKLINVTLAFEVLYKCLPITSLCVHRSCEMSKCLFTSKLVSWGLHHIIGVHQNINSLLQMLI